MKSLRRRLVLGASIILLVFLVITSWILTASMSDGLEQAIEQRLAAHSLALLAAAEIDDTGQISIPEELPEARFTMPDSGLYALLIADGLRWESPSSIGENPQLPDEMLAAGERRFSPSTDIGPENALVLAQGFAWQTPTGVTQFTIVVAENRKLFEQQLSEFRRTLWLGLAILATLLLITLLVVLRWGLRPLHEMAQEIIAIRRGRQPELSGQYPAELKPLTAALNALILSERRHLERYRNSLADLAHGLKTPLAVLRNSLEGKCDDSVDEQISRMDELITYRLNRARATGPSGINQAVLILPIAEKIVAALEKVHHERDIICEFEIRDGTEFFGDPGDLQEILGNLLDNAFKWANSRVVLTAEHLKSDAPDQSRPKLLMRVADDGPGLPESIQIMARGIRGDQRTPGHGIGLAIVADIVEAYGGSILLETPHAGGAEIVIHFG